MPKALDFILSTANNNNNKKNLSGTNFLQVDAVKVTVPYFS
jgi:hypothetical protein